MNDVEQKLASPDDDLALVLVGGGARAAYQVGFLRAVIHKHPTLNLPIITGTSAGAINATYLASRVGPLTDAIEGLVQLWRAQRVDQVFRVDGLSLLRLVLHWGLRLVSGGSFLVPEVRGLLDTSPLRRFLEHTLEPTASGDFVGIARNIAARRLRALAITTSSYTTGQSVVWVQGADIENWERANRRSRKAAITLDHVMASAALPFFFPAIKLGDGWHGDGGIRMLAPCSPAIHLGARRIIAISNRCRNSESDADRPMIQHYPPPAQIAGQMIQSMFLDDLDRDAFNLQRVNGLLAALPVEQHQGLRPVELVVVRPSRDLGRLASEFEPQLPRLFRHLTRGLGSRETTSPDLLSLLMFQEDYVERLLAVGAEDAETEGDRVAALLERRPV
ncbi:MAG: patatin-like phospholipase family protein [Acidobacteria bacterium]|nr:patatin-like phospholipase family protein [Acidobacteriota bacterium]